MGERLRTDPRFQKAMWEQNEPVAMELFQESCRLPLWKFFVMLMLQVIESTTLMARQNFSECGGTAYWTLTVMCMGIISIAAYILHVIFTNKKQRLEKIHYEY